MIYLYLITIFIMFFVFLYFEYKKYIKKKSKFPYVFLYFNEYINKEYEFGYIIIISNAILWPISLLILLIKKIKISYQLEKLMSFIYKKLNNKL